jgi:hypothetical protein
MPLISFTALLAGGIAVWAGYLGESIPTVLKAILNGTTGTLTKIPLDPDKRSGGAPATNSGDGGTGQSTGSGGGGGGGGSI